MTRLERGKVEGNHIVFRKPLDLPEGTEVDVHIETIDSAGTDVSAETALFASLPFFGMWAQREDMFDSAAWVAKERDRWQRRQKPQG
jgi:hypothetical protein